MDHKNTTNHHNKNCSTAEKDPAVRLRDNIKSLKEYPEEEHKNIEKNATDATPKRLGEANVVINVSANETHSSAQTGNMNEETTMEGTIESGRLDSNANQHHKNLDDTVKKLRREYYEKEAELSRAKDELDKQNKTAAARAVNMLQSKLHMLNEDIRNQHSSVIEFKKNVQILQDSQSDLSRQEEADLKSLRKVELEQKMFNITGQHIEHENVQRHRKRLDAEIQKRAAVLEAIIELDEDREDAKTNAKRADALLQRVDYFDKYLDPGKSMSHELKILQGQNFGQAMSKFNSLDIVRAAKTEAFTKAKESYQQKMYELNLKRKKTEEHLKNVESKKRKNLGQKAKGLKYLVDLELSVGRENSSVSAQDNLLSQNQFDKKVDAVKANLTAAEIFQQAQLNKRRGNARARQLRAGKLMDREHEISLKSNVSFIKPYDGSLGIQFYGSRGPPEAWSWIRDEIVWQVVGSALLKYYTSKKSLTLLRDEQQRLKKVEGELDVQIEFQRLERTVYEIVDYLIEAHITDMMQRLSSDVVHGSEFIHNKIFKILMQASPKTNLFDNDKNREKSQQRFDYLPSLVDEIRNKHVKSRKNAANHVTLPEVAPLINHIDPLVIVTKEEMMAAALQRSKRRTNRFSKLQTEAANIKIEEARQMVYSGDNISISTLKPLTDVPKNALQAFRGSATVKHYWNEMVFVPSGKTKRQRRRSTGDICCVQSMPISSSMAASATIFAIGSTTGWVSLYRIFPGYAHTDEINLVAECQPHKKVKNTVTQPKGAAVRSIELSADGNQVLTSHMNGHVQLFHVFGGPNEDVVFATPSGDQTKQTANRGEFPVKILQSRLHLTYAELMRPLSALRFKQGLAQKQRDRKAMKAGADWYFIECTTFHPALSFSLNHSAVMCGCRNGTIIKYNMRSGNIFHGSTVAHFEPPFLNQNDDELDSGNLGMTMHGHSKNNGDSHFIRREFFEGHDAPLLTIGWTASTIQTMISVDAEGIILEWKYTKDFFSGYGWFRPARRLNFDLQHAPGAINTHHGGSVTLVTAFVRPNCNELHFLTECNGTVRLCVVDLTTGLLWPTVIQFSSASTVYQEKSNGSAYSVNYVPGIDKANSDYYFLVVRTKLHTLSAIYTLMPELCVYFLRNLFLLMRKWW